MATNTFLEKPQSAESKTPNKFPLVLITIGVVLSALNIRPVITSTGLLLEQIQTNLAMSSVVAGVLTMLPPLCFALFGPLTPMAAARVGQLRVMFIALIVLIVGSLVRILASSTAVFLSASVVALVGVAIGNVMLPVLVKQYFPDRVGAMTTLYSTAIAMGTAVSSGLTVPVAHAMGGGSWRIGLGMWVLLALIAVVPWLGLLWRRDQRGRVSHRDQAHRWPVRLMIHNRLVWLSALYFGAQSLVAYVVFGWLVRILRTAGYSAATAGMILALLTAVLIPVALIVPTLAARRADQQIFVVISALAQVVGFGGLWLVPGGAWVWAVFIGVAGSSFPLAMTLMTLRARTAAATAALSAFTQSVGYGIAGLGPLLVGVLYSATGGWMPVFAMLFIACVIQLGAGLRLARSRYVEDEPRRIGGAHRRVPRHTLSTVLARSQV